MSTRNVRWQVGIRWNGSSYTDESARLISATGNYAVNAPGTPTVAGSGIVSQCTLVLNNYDDRYSANNPAADLYAYTNYGKYHHTWMYLNVSIDGGSNYYRIFSGVIAAMTEIGPTPGEASTVSIDCRDFCELYLNTRQSTATADMVTLYESGATELDIIEQFLDDAGLAESNYGWITHTTGVHGFDSTPEAGERGMFIIPVAWMDDESPIEECWGIAAACGGWFYNDVWSTTQPYFRYRNASHWALEAISTSGPDNEIRRSLGDYQGLQLSYDHTELYKEVTVEWASRKVGSTDVVWEPEEPIVVPAAGTKTVTAAFRTPVHSLDTLSYSASSHGGIDISADVSDDLASATPYAQRLELTFTNAHATYAAVLKNVQLTGKPIEGGPEGEVTKTSDNSFWSGRVAKRRAMRSSVWVQTESHADVLANMLMDVHEQPVAVYSLRGVKGDPQRKLGQKVRIYDSITFDTANEKAYITSMDFTLSGAGFYQNITAMDSEAIGYRYAETDPGYFVMGTNRISINSGDAGTNRGRLFY